MQRRLPRPFSPALLIAAGASLLWLTLAPRTPDLAAQVYRAGLFEREGFSIWDSNWYGGHHLPGYSLLFPPLGALLGVSVVGVAAAVASALLFERIARRHFGDQARWGIAWMAAATACDLLIGRLTFGLGVAIGLGAVLAAQYERRALTAALSALCAAASPVAGVFLALAGVATAVARRSEPPVARPTSDTHGPGRVCRTFGGSFGVAGALAAPALLVVVGMALAFPEGGRQPFGLTAALLSVGSGLALVALLPSEQRVLRASAALYAVAALAAFVFPTPMGSNATRLGATFAAPVLLCAVGPGPRRRLVVAALGVLAVWQWWAPVREVAKGAEDPSTQVAYYAPLIDFLSAQEGAPARVEVPFTRSHWEAVHLARHFPLARGWQTQLDTKHNALFYDGRLTPERYRGWLDRNAVRYVALPDVPLDASGRREAALVRRRPSFLVPLWRNAHWTVFRVRDARPILSGPGRLTALRPDSFTLHATGPGRVLVRVRHTRYWSAGTGSAHPRTCISRAGGGWTAVDVERAGRVRIAARLWPRAAC